MKIGQECEGRLKGLPTLFLSAEEFAKNTFMSIVMKTEDPASRKLISSVLHIYVSDHGNTINYDTPRLINLGDWQKQITLEVTSVRDRLMYPANVSFILAMEKETDISSFWRLREYDQIKFSTGPQGTVYCIPKECMMKTCAEDFDGDQEIILRGHT